MNKNIVLPSELQSAIGSESRDFVVKSEKAYPTKRGLGFVCFGLVWSAIVSTFVTTFLLPLFQGEQVKISFNQQIVVGSLDNIGPIILPTIMLSIFVIAGVLVMCKGVYFLFKKGGYFVGTSKSLLHYLNGTIRSISWEQFSGDIRVTGGKKKGNITLQMRTGKMVRGRDRRERYVPETIYISGVSNVFEVEKTCRRRIQEHDPTPVTTGHGTV